MSDTSPNLSMPYILPSQAQKHVTHNEALRILDTLAQLSVLAADLSVPPDSPAEGDRYIIADGASGAWAGHEGAVASFFGAEWIFHEAAPGWLAHDRAAGQILHFDGSGWLPLPGPRVLENLERAGVNAAADDTTRFSVRSEASLFSHEGAGHQVKINKAGEADTASLLFQNDFEGRAELGLAGQDDFSIKVSPDGSNWTTAISVEPARGIARMPCLQSGIVEIANDSVTAITPPGSCGFLFVTIVDSVYSQAPHSGIFVYDIGLTPMLQSLALAPSMANLGTTTLTGTTGTSGRSSLAVGAGEIRIENRFGSFRKYSYTFIGSD
ncbi:MAG: DUF2793 domain-containing protein [Pseudomonadota bacterium]|uniref:DUF2793 domain-containing protein n=1 Tax=Roseovarius TaxID=74030 RepID=UPI0022A724B7|nr:DUF2793 domain-containing protein [Roseovarius sp. EGI FJ00037]MCZ0811367.1 DUF2793 domain-containing protein [Roseovarius sp. EGI FJ00037]